jgi:predicted transposase/invertase (TIGR01784 family)
MTKVKQNKEWRREYMALHLKEQADRQLVRAEAHAEGLAEGRAKGRVEGLAEERKLTITKLLSKGYTCGEVADMLDMDEKEIKEIQTEILQTT